MAVLLSYALCTVADVKESLGIDAGNTSKDNLIIRKINYATHIIESFCNLSADHHFKQDTYTNEVYDATNTDNLVLRMRPASSISIGWRGTSQNEDNWNTIDTEDYFINSSAGILNGLSRFSGGYGAFRVTYTAGYSTIPADLAEACATLAAYFVENAASGTAVKRKREGQREVEYFQAQGSSTGGDSIIEQLGLDNVLSRYINYALAD